MCGCHWVGTRKERCEGPDREGPAPDHALGAPAERMPCHQSVLELCEPQGLTVN